LSTHKVDALHTLLAKCSRQIHRLPWILVALGPVVLFGPMLVRGKGLYWGTPLLQFVPWRQFAIQTLRQGHFPLWNPRLGMGAPLLANYQSALLYPPNVILAITGPAWGHGLLVTLHLVWAGFGMIVLARRFGLGPLAQSIAGLSFGLSGYLVARSGFLSINAAAAWLPWIILAVDCLARQASSKNLSRTAVVKAILGLALVWAFQWLAGHAQVAWYTLLLACLWAGWRAVLVGRFKGLGRTALFVAGAGVLAFALSAVQLLPTLEYLTQSHRSVAIDPDFALTYSFWPWRLMGLLMPDVFGNPAQGDYWGYGNYWEDDIYVGVLPFLLALGAAWRGVRGSGDHKLLGRLLVVFSFGSLILALGKNTPVFTFLFYNIPTFNLFQAPTRWNLILIFCLALLAAVGAASWQRPTGRSLYWTRLATAGAGAIGIAALFGAQVLPGVEPSVTRAFVLAGIWLVAAGILTLSKPEPLKPGWNAIVGLAISLDLVVAGWGLNPASPIDLYRGKSQLADQISDGQRVYMAPDIEYELKFEKTHRFEVFRQDIDWRLVRDMGLPNTPLMDGIPSVNNFDPILPDRYVTWMDTLESLPSSRRLKLLALMGVGWQASLDLDREAFVRYDVVPGADRIRMVANGIAASSPEEALSLVSSIDFDPSQTVVLEGRFQPAVTSGASGGEAVLVETDDPGSVVIRAVAPEGSWLVLSDTWYPGWRVRLDGDETQLYRADYLFRAVWVPPGEHEVEFLYQPRSVVLGAIVSLLAWLALAWSGWRWRNV
jgi:hypothetical protein